MDYDVNLNNTKKFSIPCSACGGIIILKVEYIYPKSEQLQLGGHQKYNEEQQTIFCSECFLSYNTALLEKHKAE